MVGLVTRARAISSFRRSPPDSVRKLYGQAYSNKDIIKMNMAPPAQAERLVSLLSKYSGRKGK